MPGVPRQLPIIALKRASSPMAPRRWTHPDTRSQIALRMRQAVCGAIMTMPGLPRKPAALDIHLNAEGEVEGLF